MDYIESVTFVTRDARWVEKIALGALATLLSVVVVGALALLGWAMEAFRRVIRRADEKLPDWADWSTYLADGLKLAGVLVVWYIPVAILGLIWEPLGFVASLVMSFFALGAFIILTQTGDFTRALNPRNAWELLNKNLNEWLLTAVILWAAGIAATLVGGIVCGIGLLITIPWFTVAAANLIGRVAIETGTEI
ncbi:MAG: DUF4013 domain-containing protein [Anaerolineales bacterium]